MDKPSEIQPKPQQVNITRINHTSKLTTLSKQIEKPSKIQPKPQQVNISSINHTSKLTTFSTHCVMANTN